MEKARIIDDGGVGPWLDADSVWRQAQHGEMVEEPDSYGDILCVDWSRYLRALEVELSDALGQLETFAAGRSLPSFGEGVRVIRQLLDEIAERRTIYGVEPVG